ncbi:predicted protein [Uncinocarpus reesii 1704]|uniref:Uncharacterized protein n=1 Tax=Uncinocarpus reesii (strain UAMH 1704) TaxID=336963 RepID=C4JV77_UNCRE|nr:uncharacterized protein UREG_06469 [Uncinocarpus reesii 1704]EEP81604.1 predicted protein [Uncinocarpus reesii 1704]
MGKDNSNIRKEQRPERVQARKDKRLADNSNHTAQATEGSLPQSDQPVLECPGRVHTMSAILDKLVQHKDKVEQFSNIVGIISHAAEGFNAIGLKPEIDKAKRIKELEAALKESHRVIAEDVEINRKERQRLEEEHKDLNSQKQGFAQEKEQNRKSLESEREALRRERESMEKKMKEETKQRIEAQVSRHRKDTDDKIRELERNICRLEAENTRLEKCNRELESELDRQKRIGKMALDQNAQLEDRLQKCNAKLPIHSMDIMDMVNESHAVFQKVPVSPTPISVFLRTCAAQALISRRMCDILWRPFCSKALEDTVSSSTATLQTLSNTAWQLDPELEPSWRVLTYKFVDAMAGTETNLIVQKATQDISKCLEIQVEPQYHQELRESLLAIFQNGARLWRLLRVDCMQVSVSTPADGPRTGWVAHDLPGKAELNRPDCIAENQGFKTLCLFPRFEATSAGAVCKELLFPGHALFSDSSALAEGAKELASQKMRLDQLYQQIASPISPTISDFSEDLAE